jgi:hypothetical protein
MKNLTLKTRKMKKITLAIMMLWGTIAFAQTTTINLDNIYLKQDGNIKMVIFKFPDNDGAISLAKSDNKIVLFLNLLEGYQFGRSGNVEFNVTFIKGERYTEYTTYGEITEGLTMAVVKSNIKDDPAFLTSFLSSDYMNIEMNGDKYFFSLEESTRAYQFLK